MKNPFEFGRELGPSELVDRDDEVRAVVRSMQQGGRLFLIGPRRFGKTSILRVATEQARADGTVVLRYNAEAYPTLARLGQAIVADAAGALTGTVKKAGQKVQAFFGALRPQVSFNPLDQSYTVALTAATPEGEGEALLAEVLDGLDRLAADAGKPVAVVIDEFQQVVERGGVPAEAQLRAAVQRHDHVAYVFAGSKTALLSEMTGEPSRPFYRLGARLFIGVIPREDFAPFLRSGFEDAGLPIDPEAVTAMLDLAADVPYNVQRLAHAVWNRARDRNAEETQASVTAEEVQAVLEELVHRDDPFYTQTWNRLTATQQKALLALVEEGGEGLFAKAVLRRYGLPLSTMRTALAALVRTGVAREEETQGAVRYVLEDPFFPAWLRLFVVGP
jgi:AAA+ ATPase superfamily predicted ATPase